MSAIVAPGCPFGRPGFRPLFFRSDFGAGFASPSDDGGLEEFREFIAVRAARSATCPCRTATRSRSAAISASRSAISSRSRAFAERSPAASSGTPGISSTGRTTPQHATPGKKANAKLETLHQHAEPEKGGAAGHAVCSAHVSRELAGAAGDGTAAALMIGADARSA